MNISNITAERLKNRGKTTERGIKEEPQILPEPVLDIKEFFKETIDNGGEAFLSSEERYARFLAENNIIDENSSVEVYEIYGTVGLSDLFRSAKHKLSEEQAAAFSGIENVRAYLDSSNCNCQTKKAKLEEYYKDFVLGNSNSDLFPSMKKDSSVKKIVFYYENQTILEI